MPDTMTGADVLRAFMRAAGLSSYQGVADRLGVSRTLVWQWSCENQRREPRKMHRLAMAAVIADLPPFQPKENRVG